jgi:hypothetical protein
MLMATTVAPGITAPVGSVTVPVTAPVTVWAAPVPTQSSTAINEPTHIRMKLIFIALQPSSLHSRNAGWEIRVISATISAQPLNRLVINDCFDRNIKKY